MRMRTQALVLFLASFGLVAAAEPAAPQAFVVIVHADNPLKAIGREDLSRMFLRRTSKWPGGQHAEPVDLKPDADVRVAFTEAVHRKAVRSIRAFWQQQIFSGRDVPPPEKSSEKEVLAFVKENPGAVGYVSGNVPLVVGVKALVVE